MAKGVAVLVQCVLLGERVTVAVGEDSYCGCRERELLWL